MKRFWDLTRESAVDAFKTFFNPLKLIKRLFGKSS